MHKRLSKPKGGGVGVGVRFLTSLINFSVLLRLIIIVNSSVILTFRLKTIVTLFNFGNVFLHFLELFMQNNVPVM